MAAVTGRFQPFHRGHLDLVDLAVAEADEVVIGITNPDPASWREHADSAHRHRPESNPFTYWERHRMISAALVDAGLAGRCTIVPFPLDRPDVWSDYIPNDAVQFVRAFTPWERAKAEQLRAGGYDVRVIEGDPESAIRASSIRAAWREGRREQVASLLPDASARAMRRVVTEGSVAS